jgi:hypothetical protein
MGCIWVRDEVLRERDQQRSLRLTDLRGRRDAKKAAQTSGGLYFNFPA